MSIRANRSTAAFAVLAIVVAAVAALVALPGGRASAANHAVSIVDFSFNPASLTVAAGDTVVWTNTGQAPHTVTSSDGFLSSGNLAAGATYSKTFATAGTFTYACQIHPQMTGTVTVQAASQATPAGTAAGGATTPAGSGSGSSPSAPSTGTGLESTDSSSALLPAGLALLAVGGAAAATAAVVRRRS